MDVKAAALKLMFLSGEVSKREKFLWRYLLDLDTDTVGVAVDNLLILQYNNHCKCDEGEERHGYPSPERRHRG